MNALPNKLSAITYALSKTVTFYYAQEPSAFAAVVYVLYLSFVLTLSAICPCTPYHLIGPFCSSCRCYHSAQCSKRRPRSNNYTNVLIYHISESTEAFL